MNKFLIVDDTFTSRRMVSAAVRKLGLEDVEYDEASNGEEAWALLEAGAYDMVITDLYMPVMSGLDLLLRAQERGLAIPFVVVTSERSPVVLEKLRDAGAHAILSKPIPIHELQQTVAAVVH